MLGFCIYRVEGDSMSPSFLPGDYVLSLKLPFQWLRPDQVILVKHPELGLMIKRILTVNNQDPSHLQLIGDNLALSTSTQAIGQVKPSQVLGKVICRISAAK